MDHHFERYFPFYLCAALAFFFVLAMSAGATGRKAHALAVTHCQENNMVLVDTPAGERCAPAWALKRTS
jgi:hypothetical protein